MILQMMASSTDRNRFHKRKIANSHPTDLWLIEEYHRMMNVFRNRDVRVSNSYLRSSCSKRSSCQLFKFNIELQSSVVSY